MLLKMSFHVTAFLAAENTYVLDAGMHFTHKKKVATCLLI